ncbi:MAG: PAS domain S-box protein, partial [Sphingobacteriales bacterium]
DAQQRASLKVLENVPNMYLVIDPDLYIITASNLFLQATQTTREAIAGRHIFEAFPDNPELPDADGVKNINFSIQEVLRTGKPHFMEIQRYDVPDVLAPGTFITRYWEPSHTPVFDDDGHIAYIIQHANNITDKVLRLAELAESRNLELKALQKIELLNLELDVLRIAELDREKNEKHFRHLADLVPAKISNALPTGEVTYFNKQWLEYSGMNFEDLRDFGYHQMMHPDELATFQAGLQQAAATGIPYESEMRFKDLTGKYRWHLNIAAPILNDQGKVILWVGSTTDIQRLKDEDQRKSDFLSMLSHELKTPVTSIKGYVQIIDSIITAGTDKAAFPPMLQSSVVRIDKLINKLTGLITEMLDFARLEANRMTLDKCQANMSTLVDI